MFRRLFLFGFTPILVMLSMSTTSWAAIPKKCTTGEGKSAKVLQLEAEQLYQDVAAYEDLSEYQEKDTNFTERSFVFLRNKITGPHFVQTFQALKYSACLRKDLRDIEDAIGKVTSLLPRKSIWKSEHKKQLDEFMNRIDALEKELTNLRQCGAKEPNTDAGEKNPYFRKEYLKSECSGGEKELFTLTRNRFRELWEKIRNLGKKQGWKEIFQGWKELDSTKTKLEIERQAAAQARSWIQKYNVPKMLGIERFVVSEVEKKEKNAATKADTVSDDTGKKAKAATEAASEDAAYEAFRKLGEKDAQITALRQAEEEDLRNLSQAQEGYVAAELFSEQITKAIISVQTQTEMLKKWRKDLGRFVRKQAQNQK